MLTAYGARLPVTLSLSPMQEEEYQGICMVATDLTRQYTREAELRSTNERLAKQVEETRRAKEALRQLSGKLLQVEDEARRRVARDLHDSTSQILCAVAVNLSMIQQHVANKGDEKAMKLVADTEELAEQAAREIRDISHLLHPPSLDAVGLPAALRWHANNFKKISGIEVSMSVPNDFGRLPQDLETALYRVAQECLTNVQRHSGSDSAAVRLARVEGTVILEVQDRGRGINPDSLRDSEGVARPGIGLAGMRGRLRQLGGHLEIQSGNGALIRAVVPLQRDL
jgi:signal transduction histidine kinase